MSDVPKRAANVIEALLPRERISKLIDSERIRFIDELLENIYTITCEDIKQQEEVDRAKAAVEFSSKFNTDTVDKAVGDIIREIPMNKLINVVITLIAESLKDQLKDDRSKCLMSAGVACLMTGRSMHEIFNEMKQFIIDKSSKDKEGEA